MACEMAGAYALEKGIDLVRFAAGDQFHTAVGQVYDRSRDIIFAGQIFDGVAEADTLHAAFVVDAEGFHGRRQGLTTEDTENAEIENEFFHGSVVLDVGFAGLDERFNFPADFIQQGFLFSRFAGKRRQRLAYRSHHKGASIADGFQ